MTDSTIMAISKSLNADTCRNLIEISTPLVELGINAFFYSKFYEANRVSLLSNNLKWLEHLKINFQRYKMNFEGQFHFRPGFSIDYLNYFTYSKMTKDMIEHDMKNAIYLSNVSRDRKYSETFVFTTSDDGDKSNQRLSSKIDNLNEFCLIFKDKANSIIQDTQVTVNELHQCKNIKESSVEFMKITPGIKRYYLGSPNENVFLTPKEFEYLSEYLQGKSAKMIGNLYSVSPRTIEKRLESIKKKLSCHNKSELIEKIIYSQLFYPHFCK
jgi:DNA-binding CsgD family transcriptional regulator